MCQKQRQINLIKIVSKNPTSRMIYKEACFYFHTIFKFQADKKTS